MAQVSYGTITITDTNDVESIVVEYNRNQSTTTPPTQTDSGWSTNRPTWAQGYYIWQRTRTHKSGTQASEDILGNAVCLTGSTGQTGATGRGVTGVETLYATNNSATTAPTSGWQAQPPTYDSSKPKYWVKVTTTYNSGNPDVVTYLDNGITDAMATAAAANSTANTANQTANNAKDKADSVEGNLNNYITSNNNVISALQTKTKYFWTNLVAHTNGSGGWTKPNYPVGTYAASGISGTTFDEENSSTYGYNTLYANGIKLRYNAINLGELTGSSLVFYRPSTTAQGSKGMELTSTTLKFYDATGSIAQATFGGTQATISGTINVYDGKIGNNANNYWYIGNYTDYNQNISAIIKSIGTASIQLNETDTWRVSTNRIHTAWAPETGTDAFKLHFPLFIDSSSNNKHWDFGLHLPTSYSDKFLYVRNAPSTQTLDNLLNDLEDAGYDYWSYKFYIDASGNVHSPSYYIINNDGSEQPLSGSGLVASSLSCGTVGSITHPVYFNSGVPALTTYELNAAGAKDIVTDIAANSSSTNLPTAAAVVNYVTSRGYLTVDEKVKVENKNTTKLWITGTATSSTNTGTLAYDSNIYIDTTAGALHATTFNGYTLAAASAKGVDTSLTATSTSTNLPTSKAVTDLIKQYLPLIGGSITGPVNFGDSVSIDDLTAGNLIVNGAGRFTNGLYGDLIGNADTATKVGNDLKIQLNGGTTEGTNQFTFNGSVAKTVNITKSSVGLGNVENKSSATIRGELTSSNVTTALGFTPYNATNPNGYTTNTGTVTSVAASGSGGITISGSPITTSGTIAVGLNLSTAINGLGEGSSNATRNDYIVAQYAGGGTTTTTYHRRKLSNIFAALNSSDITTALGYTPYDAANPNGYTTNTGTVTSVKVQGSNGLTGSGTVATSGTITLSHADTSSQASSSNSGRTYIQSVTLDGYGHVTGLSTATETVTDTHYTANLITGASATAKANAVATNGSVYLNLIENNTVRNAHKIVGSGTTTVTSDADGVITISSADSKTGTVTSITLTQGTGISIGSSGTAITTSGTRTIALADNYGDTKNPYASKTARYVLAAPANAAGAPSFRALTGADVGLGSVLNATQVTGIGQGADGKIRVYKGDSNYEDVAVEIVATESSSVASAQKLTSYGGSTKQPVYFPNSGTNAGKPVAIGYTIETSVPSGAVFTDTTYTFASGTNGFTVTPLNGTAQTVTVTPSIANNVTGSGTSGYLAKFNGANTITNGPALGTDATKFLNNKGEWVVPSGTYSLPLAANGTRGGVQIGYTQSGKNYPVQLSSEKMYVNVPWTDTTYSIATGDSNGQIKITPSSGSAYNINVKGLGSAAFANTSLFPIVSTYQLAAGKAVRIQYPTYVPVLISAQRSNGGGRLILLGGGYGSEGTVRNDFQEVVSSNVNRFTWTLPSSSSVSNSIEIMNVNTSGDATITVWSSSAVTFTEIDALSDTAMNRKLITSANYTDYTVTKTGTGASGTWGINISGNATSSTKANITTVQNSIAKYSDTSGTFTDSYITIDSSGNLIIGDNDHPANIKIGAKNDNYGLMPNVNNYNQIGSSSLFWYRSYINNYYGNNSHVNNWDSDKNIGTAATSSATSTLGNVNFYNTCAAGGTQTKTKLTADASTASNITVTLPKETGTLALTKNYQPYAHYSNQNGNNSGKYYKININSYVGWMLNFTVKIYHSYRAYDLQISGYNYGSNHWYQPQAILLGASTNESLNVLFGYDSDYHLWMAIPAQQYTGIDVVNVTNGFNQVDSLEGLFTIEMVDGEPTTVQQTITAYRPWYRNETVSDAINATNATNATSSTYATNLLAYAGNEVTIGANSTTRNECTNDKVYINFRDVNNGSSSNTSTAITDYYFCNRKGSTDGVNVRANTFIGNLTGTATKATQDGDGNTIASTYLKLSGGVMTGGLAVEASNSYSSYNEGIRINAGARTYATLLMGGTNGTTSGINDGAFWIGVYNTGSYARRLMIAHNGSTGTNTYFYSNAAGTVSPWLHLGNSGTITSGNADAVTGGVVYTAINNLSGSYVKTTGNEGILGTKVFNSGTSYGTVTNNTTYTEKANINYDSTLEAIVFSFS